MKKTHPVRTPRLALDATTVRRLDDQALQQVDGGVALRSINSCTCICTISKPD